MVILAKIVLMGDGAVGKTTLRNSFMGQKISGEYLMTIGADFSLKELSVIYDGKEYEMKFQIWDLAGQHRFENVRALFYIATMGGILVYDITRPETFENTVKWLRELKNNFKSKGNSPPVVLIGNKADLRDEVDYFVTKEQGESLAKSLTRNYSNNLFNIHFFETSAITGENVDLAFQTLGEQIIYLSNE